jgi:hypothetical protein
MSAVRVTRLAHRTAQVAISKVCGRHVTRLGRRRSNPVAGGLWRGTLTT